MPQMRATFFFEDNKYGWSESVWVAGGPQGYEIVGDAAKNLLTLRLQMLGNTTLALYIRISDDLLQRDAYVIAPGVGPNQLGGVLAPAQAALQPYYTVMSRWDTPDFRTHGINFLGGIPFDVVPNPFNAALLKPAWLKAFNNWANVIIAGDALTGVKWGFRCFDRGTAPQGTITKIVNATSTITAPGLVAAVGDPVVVSGTSPSRPFGGNYHVTAVAGNDFTVDQGAKWGAVVYQNGGTLFKKIKTIVAPISIIPIGATHRNRGRPFGSPRGRRRLTA